MAASLPKQVPARQPGAAVLWPIPLPGGAPAGVWTLEVLADPAAPPIGRAEFRVDAFVPERLEVTAGPAPGRWCPASRWRCRSPRASSMARPAPG